MASPVSSSRIFFSRYKYKVFVATSSVNLMDRLLRSSQSCYNLTLNNVYNIKTIVFSLLQNSIFNNVAFRTDLNLVTNETFLILIP